MSYENVRLPDANAECVCVIGGTSTIWESASARRRKLKCSQCQSRVLLRVPFAVEGYRLLLDVIELDLHIKRVTVGSLRDILDTNDWKNVCQLQRGYVSDNETDLAERSRRWKTSGHRMGADETTNGSIILYPWHIDAFSSCSSLF